MIDLGNLSEEVRRRCEKVEIILSDVDGVLTDGRMLLDGRGNEAQFFHIRDGLGIQLWQRAGFHFGILSHRSSQAVRLRAAEVGVAIVRQSVESKLAAAEEILEQLRLPMDHLCYVGDDLLDLPLLRRAGLGVAVADAAPEVRAVAPLITTLPGGHGAVREVVELLLKAKDRWEALVASIAR